MTLRYLYEITATLSAVFAIHYALRFRAQRNRQSGLVEFQKDRAEKLLEEVHRVQKDAVETFSMLKEAQLDLESQKARIAAEIEIRVGFQNKVAGAEQERDSAIQKAVDFQAQIGNLHDELERQMARFSALLLKNGEVTAILSACERSRDDWKKRCEAFQRITTKDAQTLELELAKQRIEELRQDLESVSPKRDASGRFVKKTA